MGIFSALHLTQVSLGGGQNESNLFSGLNFSNLPNFFTKKIQQNQYLVHLSSYSSLHQKYQNLTLEPDRNSRYYRTKVHKIIRNSLLSFERLEKYGEPV